MPNQVDVIRFNTPGGWVTRWLVQLRLPEGGTFAVEVAANVRAEKGCMDMEFGASRDGPGYELSATFCLEPSRKLLLDVLYKQCGWKPMAKPKPPTRFDIILADD